MGNTVERSEYSEAFRHMLRQAGTEPVRLPQ